VSGVDLGGHVVGELIELAQITRHVDVAHLQVAAKRAVVQLTGDVDAT
jgi:hypothetical protein